MINNINIFLVMILAAAWLVAIYFPPKWLIIK